ncbi:MAG: CaiB/BaiF CoA-transferase family protein [Pseudomonadota bacterium]|nr:CaiB/BaiF CoA-transferase family protein [Pseudomonadota bacterium]
MPSALSHIRVLDLSRILAGPSSTQILSDLGAEVIKIEHPLRGDDTRAWGPPFLDDPAGNGIGESAYFLAANRGKKSVAMDIASTSGADIVRRLAVHCDVVVENFKVGGLKKYGLDYDSLRRVKSDLIYCSITGFGQTGPRAHRPGYDLLAQAQGGLMSITGERDDLPGGGPQKVGVAAADLMTGMYACVSVLAALAYRERTGQGQHTDLALLDSQVAMLANQGMYYLVSGESPGRSGNAHASVVPYGTFAVADGEVVMGIGNDRQFQRFCEVAGLADVAKDDRFRHNRDRVQNRDALAAMMDPVLLTRSRAEWLDALERVGVPCGPINSIGEVFADAHVKAREMCWTQDHPFRKDLKLVASPIRMSVTPPRPQGSPPLLGQHTAEVLDGLLGLGQSEIDNLEQNGIIFCASPATPHHHTTA